MDVTSLQVSIGADISAFQDSINAMIMALDNVADSIQEIADRFIEAGTEIGESAKESAGSISEFGGKFMEITERSEKLGGAFEKATTIVKLFSGALESGEAVTGGIITLISVLVAVAVECYNKFDTFRGIVDAVWAVVKDLAIIVGDALIGEFKILYDIVGWLVDMFKDFGTIIMVSAIAPLKLVVDAMQALYYAVVAVDWSKAYDSIKTFGSDAVKAAGMIKDAAVDTLTSSKSMAQNVAQDFTDSAQKISEVTSGITSDVGKAYEDAFKKTAKVESPKIKTDLLTLTPGKIKIDASASFSDVTLPQSDANIQSIAPSSSQNVPTSQAGGLADGTGIVPVQGIQASTNAIKEYKEGLDEAAQAQKGLQNIAVAAFLDIGDALGEMMAGQKKINPLAVLMKQMGDAFKQYAAFLISAGTGMLLTGDPMGAPKVAEGIGLEAVGTAMGAIKMAQGGVVSGSTFANIGEYAGASHNPEVVAPLDKLRNMLGGGNNNHQFSFQIAGDNLLSIQDRVQNNSQFVMGTNNQ